MTVNILSAFSNHFNDFDMCAVESRVEEDIIADFSREINEVKERNERVPKSEESF